VNIVGFIIRILDAALGREHAVVFTKVNVKVKQSH